MQDVTTLHSILAPSSASRWIRCAGSPKAEHGKRDIDGVAAREGTALHEVAFRSLAGKGDTSPGDAIEGVIITEEGLDSVEHYIQYVNSIRGKNAQLEQRVDCSVIHPECFGTPDYWEFFESDMILEIADYKNGHGDVSPYENWQMLVYLSGITATLTVKLPFLPVDELTIRITVVQPNSTKGGDVIKQWVITGVELAGYTQRLQQAAANAMSDNPICMPSPDGCKNCKARMTCDAFNRTMDNLAECVVYAPAPEGYDVGFKLIQIRALQTMVKAMETACAAEALALMQEGTSVSGCEIGNGRGKLAWSGTIEETAVIADMMGVDIMKPPERRTPTQVKMKLKKAGLPENLFENHTKYHKGKQIVKPVDLSKTKLAFGGK